MSRVNSIYSFGFEPLQWCVVGQYAFLGVVVVQDVPLLTLPLNVFETNIFAKTSLFICSVFTDLKWALFKTLTVTYYYNCTNGPFLMLVN